MKLRGRWVVSAVVLSSLSVAGAVGVAAATGHAPTWITPDGVASATADAKPVRLAAIPARQAAHQPKQPNRPADRQRGHDDGRPVYDENTVLVRFKPGASKAARDKALSRRGAQAVGDTLPGGFVKVKTDGDAAAVVGALADDPAVAKVSLNLARRTTAVPNDPYYAADQKYLATVRLPQAWDLVKDASTQVIAVVDTGVDTRHPDLTGRTVAGYNAVSPGAAPTDYDPDLVEAGGHGTMVAGIAAANTSNAVGVAGAAWNGRVMPIKVFRTDSYAYDSDIAAGVTWAADHGAKVINMSLGGPGETPVLHEAIKYAIGKGALVVVAAGQLVHRRTGVPGGVPGGTGGRRHRHQRGQDGLQHLGRLGGRGRARASPSPRRTRGTPRTSTPPATAPRSPRPWWPASPR